MSSPLPPSKFGAGTTYGEAGRAHALPQTPPAPPPPPPRPPAPQSYPPPDPYGAAYSAPQPVSPPVAPSYAMPTADPYAAAQSSAYPVYPAAGPAGRPGGGTAIAGAILSLVGALWYGVDTVRNWSSFEYVFQMLGNSSALGMTDGWTYGFIAAAIAQLVFVVLLLVGGILLLTRSSLGRGLAVAGSALVIAANGYLAFAGLQTVSNINAFLDGAGMGAMTRNDLIAEILLNTGLPALIAVVALVMLMAGSTKQWCRPIAQTY